MNQKPPKGTYYDEKTGYYRFKDTGVYFHRWVMKQYLTQHKKSPLRRGEIVHHKNGNKLDNRPENLEVVNFAEHFKIHYGPAIKAEGNTELWQQIMPVLDSFEAERDWRDFNAGSIGVALVGLIMLLVGLIMPRTLTLWEAGVGLIIIGVFYRLFGYKIVDKMS